MIIARSLADTIPDLCTKACREADTRRHRCRCHCGGRWHGVAEVQAAEISNPQGITGPSDAG